MKKWVALIVVLAAGTGGYWWYVNWQKNRPAAADPQHPTTAVVENRTIQFAINAAGDIGPADQVSVRPQVSGIIKTLPVDIGDKVTKGDLLFTLDDQDLQTERASKLIQIQAAKLQMDKAERDDRRSEQLYNAKLISQELFEDTRTTYALAKTTVDQMEKDLHLIEYQITLTKIVAPFDCTILTRPVSNGQAVAGAGSFNSGTEVMTIANLNNMIVNAHINQADVTRLNDDQIVDIQVESVPGLKMKGTVQRIAPQATIKNNIKGYDAQILIKEIDPRVRPGMTATLSIPVASAQNALAVPLAAVFTEQNPDSQQTERFVLVKKDTGYERRPVHVGVADYDYAEVLSGLKPGETVALELPPGVSVTPTATGTNGDNRSIAAGGSVAPRPATTAANTNAAAPAGIGTATRTNASSTGSSSVSSGAPRGLQASAAGASTAR